MKYLQFILFIFAFSGILFFAHGQASIVSAIGDKKNQKIAPSYPYVFPENRADYTGWLLKGEAYSNFMKHQLPATKQEWETYSRNLKTEIIKNAGITSTPDLALDDHETGTIAGNGFTVKNIYFQTLPNVYATASLYIPEGKGPFPAVINLNGHWDGARLCTQVQSVSQSLAHNGYVVLAIDAFGSGERGTVHGIGEYHGSSLGASLMNLGTTLLGIQVSENMRGVDLLCSLAFVDSGKIGVTGASGGGNQTMWLAALDERIQAAVPVVSVGTFESYIMESNCVCELLPNGLTLTEESGILALMAPRAVLLLNHNFDPSPTFRPAEMLRTYHNAKPVFELLGAGKKISYQLFDLPHDYSQHDVEAMIKWFNFHLKKIQSEIQVITVPFQTFPEGQLMVFAKGKRDPKVPGIQEYCKKKGGELKNNMPTSGSNPINQKKADLRTILRVNDSVNISEVHQYSKTGIWDRFALELTNGRMIPLLHLPPRRKEMGYTVFIHPKGKEFISEAIISEWKEKGAGIVIADLFGTGEVSSPKANEIDQDLVQFHTIARAELWLGKTVMGDWVTELQLIGRFLKNNFQTKSIRIDASREAGLAALYFSVLNEGAVHSLNLREAPVSYLFDEREGINFFSLAIHLPGILNWGDVSLAAALSSIDIQFINPVSMSGNAIRDEKLQATEAEFEFMKQKYREPGKIRFTVN